MGLFGGKKSKIKKMETLAPNQMELLNNLIMSLTGQGGGPFSQLNMSPEEMNRRFQEGVRDPAMLNFQRSTIPQIMQSFADQGASSGLYQTLGAAGKDLESNLASQQMQFNQQGIQNLLQALGIGIGTQTFQPYVKEGRAGAGPGVLSGAASGAATGAAFGPWGALGGGVLGGLTGLFSR